MTSLQVGCLVLAAAGLSLLFSRERPVNLAGLQVIAAAGLFAELTSVGWTVAFAVLGFGLMLFAVGRTLRKVAGDPRT